MKTIAIACMILSWNVFAKEEVKPERVNELVTVQELLEVERRGCCSHHGGVSHCSMGSLICSDGWVSSCGCFKQE